MSTHTLLQHTAQEVCGIACDLTVETVTLPGLGRQLHISQHSAFACDLVILGEREAREVAAALLEGVARLQATPHPLPRKRSFWERCADWWSGLPWTDPSPHERQEAAELLSGIRASKK